MSTAIITMRGFYGVPRLSRHMIDRPALMDALDQPHPLVVVRGPFGSGKTTLLAQWAARRGGCGVWATLSEETSTRQAFWEHVLTLMSDAGVSSRGNGFDEAARAVGTSPDLRALLCRVSASLVDPLTLVIDEYGFVEDPEIHDDIVTMLRQSSPLRITVVTRSVSRLEDARLGLELDRLILDSDRLAFSIEETVEFLRVAQVEATAPLVARLHAALGGMPLAVRAAGAAMRSDRARVLGDLADGRLVEGIVSHFTLTMREKYTGTPYWDFLMRISVAGSVAPPLAAELGGVSPGVALGYLSRAEADGFGMWRNGGYGDEGVSRFSLSALVRGALHNQLMRTTPRTANDLHRAYANWCHRNGDSVTAVLESVRAGDLDSATRALRSCLLVIGHLHGDALTALLKDIPQSRLKRYPVLALFVALHLNTREETHARGLEWFRLAGLTARSRGRQTEDETNAFTFAAIEAVSARMLGRETTALGAADRAMTVYRGMSKGGREDLGGGTAQLLSLAGTTYWLGGRISQALDVYREACAAGSGSADERLSVALLAGVHAFHGDMPSAADAVERGRAFDRPVEGRHDPLGVPFRLAEAFGALEDFDLEAAQAQIDLARDAFRPHGLWALFVPAQAFIDAAAGRPQAGLARLRDSRQLAIRPATSSHLAVVHDVWRVLLHLSGGEVGAAVAVAGKLPARHPGKAIADALLALLTGDPAHAVAQTYPSQGEKDWCVEFDPRSEAILLLIRAAAAARSGHDGLALQSLDAAIAVMDRFRLNLPLAFIPAQDRSALRALAGAAGARYSAEAMDAREAVRAIPSLFPGTARKIVLTPREQRLLQYLSGTAASISQIAEALYVAPKTLRNQRTSLYRKLGVATRADATRVAYEQKILSR